MSTTDTVSDLTTLRGTAESVRTGTEPAGGSRMITTAVHRRPWLQVVNLLLAVAALVISVFALTTSRDLPPSVPPQPTPTDPSSNPLLPGCNLGLGVCLNPGVPD